MWYSRWVQYKFTGKNNFFIICAAISLRSLFFCGLTTSEKNLNHSRILWAHCKCLPPILSDWQTLKMGYCLTNIWRNWEFKKYCNHNQRLSSKKMSSWKWASNFKLLFGLQWSMSNPGSRTPFISGLWSFLLSHEGFFFLLLIKSKIQWSLECPENSETKWVLLVSLQEEIATVF